MARNGALLAGIVLAGGICVLAAPVLTTQRGAWGPLILDARSPLLAVLAIAGCIVLAAVVAGVVGRIINTAVGWFVLGIGLFVLAGRLENVSELIFSHPSMEGQHVGILLGVESILWAGLALIGVVIVWLVSGKLKDVSPDEQNRAPSPWTGSDALKSFAAGILVLPLVWLVARSSITGQTVAAVWVGSMVVGLVGRLWSPHVQPVLICVSPIVFGALAHVSSVFLLDGTVNDAFINDAMSPFLRVMPIHYAAGALVGVPMGLGWARSFLHHEDQAEKSDVSRHVEPSSAGAPST